jgi:hypothetical protein
MPPLMTVCPSPPRREPCTIWPPASRSTSSTAALGHEPRRAAERRLVALISQACLPLPETNVQVDGFRYHSTRQAFERDRASRG